MDALNADANEAQAMIVTTVVVVRLTHALVMIDRTAHRAGTVREMPESRIETLMIVPILIFRKSGNMVINNKNLRHIFLITVNSVRHLCTTALFPTKDTSMLLDRRLFSNRISK